MNKVTALSVRQARHRFSWTT